MVQNNDGTFGMKVGVYKFKSRFDNGEEVDVRVEKIDVTAVAGGHHGWRCRCRRTRSPAPPSCAPPSARRLCAILGSGGLRER